MYLCQVRRSRGRRLQHTVQGRSPLISRDMMTTIETSTTNIKTLVTSIQMHQEEAVSAYSYPDGAEWRRLFSCGRYTDPSLAAKQLPMINEAAAGDKVKQPPMFEERETKYIF